jgi:DNA uptake protein ComE-like DNA-binding protein
MILSCFLTVCVQILSLHAIGQVRALRILTARNGGEPFTALEDLQQVGMNSKQIQKFLQSNAAAFVVA